MFINFSGSQSSLQSNIQSCCYICRKWRHQFFFGGGGKTHLTAIFAHSAAFKRRRGCRGLWGTQIYETFWISASRYFCNIAGFLSVHSLGWTISARGSLKCSQAYVFIKLYNSILYTWIQYSFRLLIHFLWQRVVMQNIDFVQFSALLCSLQYSGFFFFNAETI